VGPAVSHGREGNISHLKEGGKRYYQRGYNNTSVTGDRGEDDAIQRKRRKLGGGGSSIYFRRA